MSRLLSLLRIQATWSLYLVQVATASVLGWTFEWDWIQQPPDLTFSYCTPWSVIVQLHDNITQPTPPYYMITYALNGVTQKTLIGSDNNNLTYVVTQPVGTRVALQVVDSKGDPGGVLPDIYEVVRGSTTQCAFPAPLVVDSSFTATANVTNTTADGIINNCQPWQIRLAGGTPPYHISFVQTDGTTTTNVTMPSSDNVYTYVNSTIPNKNTLIAAVSDATGMWASNPPYVRTVQTDPSPICFGRSSSTYIPTQTRSANWRHTLVIALPASISGCLVILLFIWMCRRRRKLAQEKRTTASILDAPTDLRVTGIHTEFPRYSRELTMHHPGTASPTNATSHLQDLSNSYLTTPFHTSGVGPSSSTMRISNPSPLDEPTGPSFLLSSKGSVQKPTPLFSNSQNPNTGNIGKSDHRDQAPSARLDDLPPPYIPSAPSETQLSSK